MKYKVGDRVRVRRDLEENKTYGGWDALEDMVKMRGEIVTIKRVRSSAYELEEKGLMWTDEMFEGLVEDELTAEEAIRLKCEMCDGRFCNDCKLSSRNNGMGVKCNVLGKNHPERYIEILKQFKKYYEKKEIETEIVDLIRIMKEEGDSTTCIYAYEIDAKEEDIDEKMDKLVKQYYEENGGKIYAKFERIRRVKKLMKRPFREVNIWQ